MKTITSTELARNLKRVLDQVEFQGEELAVMRNNQPIARIVPGTTRQTALQAMADLYRTLPEAAAVDWMRHSRLAKLSSRARNPWRA